MPELPEVKTTTDYLRSRILGFKIKDVWCDWNKYLKTRCFSLDGKFSSDKVISLASFKKEICNSSFKNIERIGKNIFFILERQRKYFVWHVHMKMTGHFLLIDPLKYKIQGKQIVPLQIDKKNDPFLDSYNKYIHFYLLIIKGQQKSILAFSDLRKFGKMILYELPDDKYEFWLERILKNEKIGFDVWDQRLNAKDLKLLFKNKKSLLRKVLMDQSNIAGIGNIYADEILFDARIYPLKKVASLGQRDYQRLIKSTRKILKRAIKYKGTSERDFRLPNGKKGQNQNFLKVYSREGQLCLRCKTGKIKKIKIAGRTARFCPKCQKGKR